MAEFLLDLCCLLEGKQSPAPHSRHTQRFPHSGAHWKAQAAPVHDGSGLTSLSLTAESPSQEGHEVFAEGLFILSSSNPAEKPQSKPCSKEIILTLSIETQRVSMSSLSPVSDGAAGFSINYLIAVFEKCP